MRLKTTLTVKTALGYIAIAVLSVVVFVSSFFILSSARRIDREISESIVPSLVLCKDMNMLFGEIKRLDNSWIYTPNADEKDRLRTVLEGEVPLLKERITELEEKSSATDHGERMRQLSSAIDDIVRKSQNLTTILATDKAYANDANVDRALGLYEKEILPASRAADKLITASIKVYNESLTSLQIEKQDSYYTLTIGFLLMFAATVIVGAVAVFISNRIIIRPIRKLKKVINALGKGEIMEVEQVDVYDEISEMRNSISNMLSGLRESANFAVDIGTGNYEKQFNPLSDKDQMGNALLNMRDSLKKHAEEEQRRSWATVGVAQLSEILRQNDLTVAELGDEIITFVIKYIEGNQGALFILEKDEKGEEGLFMRACYAYSKKKHVEKMIRPGEGIVGQCYLEGGVVQMNEVPADYVKITTGLGGAVPRNLLIVPLKINDSVFGVLELASFSEFKPHAVEFMKKITEIIASELQSVRVNERTRQLLSESQVQAEELRAREEELRQNMEELRAAQDQMTKKEEGYVEQIKNLQSKAVPENVNSR